MPSAYLTQETEGKIYDLPGRDHTFEPVNHVTFGDLHGNALKFIFLLIRTGIMTLQQDDDYHRLITIYNDTKLTPIYNDTKLIAEKITSFIKILDEATIDNRKSLTLIGDELCDRGHNDWLTLLIFKRLNHAELNIEIVLSNHSLGFLEFFESNTNRILINYNHHLTASLVGLKALIKQKIVTKDALKALVQNDYIPHVKAISYTYAQETQSAPNTLTIYTHAPSSLGIIANLAKVLGVHYEHTTPEHLMKSIDDINLKIKTLLQNQTLTHEIIQNEMLKEAMHFLVFHRKFIRACDCKPHNAEINYNIKFVHGHIGAGYLKSNEILNAPSHFHTNLDNDFGKSLPDDPNLKGAYVIGYTWQLTAKQLAEIKSLANTKKPDEVSNTPQSKAVLSKERQSCARTSQFFHESKNLPREQKTNPLTPIIPQHKRKVFDRLYPSPKTF